MRGSRVAIIGHRSLILSALGIFGRTQSRTPEKVCTKTVQTLFPLVALLFFPSVTKRNIKPLVAATADAKIIDSLTLTRPPALSFRAKLAIKVDIVKPIPASIPMPSNLRFVIESGRRDHPIFSTERTPKRIPIGFPTTSPRKTPIATGSSSNARKVSADKLMPAFKKTNSGKITKATGNSNPCSQ